MLFLARDVQLVRKATSGPMEKDDPFRSSDSCKTQPVAVKKTAKPRNPFLEVKPGFLAAPYFREAGSVPVERHSRSWSGDTEAVGG